jgi:hypothetical protein
MRLTYVLSAAAIFAALLGVTSDAQEAKTVIDVAKPGPQVGQQNNA